ncbi:MAG: transposase [Synergistales bacterium]
MRPFGGPCPEGGVPGAEVAILRCFSTRISNGLLEGLNSLFQAARTKARGYRSLKYGIQVFYIVGGRFEFQLSKSYAVTHTK